MTRSRTGRWKACVATAALALTVGATGTGTAVAQSTEPPASGSVSVPASAMQEATPATGEAGPAHEEAAPQDDPHKNDIWVPDWMLLVIAGLVVAAAVSVATQSYLRFATTRRDLEG